MEVIDTSKEQDAIARLIFRLVVLPGANLDRAVYHLQAALYQLEHPTNESPKTDATSV